MENPGGAIGMALISLSMINTITVGAFVFSFALIKASGGEMPGDGYRCLATPIASNLSILQKGARKQLSHSLTPFSKTIKIRNCRPCKLTSR